ncbi:hypothetical protein CVIRNUC_004862 [Coccomyxa viridis]|uniref:phosphoethanolamine N-methyltransferase n=1 Tax=Coccomyxa viridis TaxID=1274662 RepID=A0AAV1I6X7_9CHLO|nr:hypothetical protein CVIRNUC_004862 [Coccomyxa viridis]
MGSLKLVAPPVEDPVQERTLQKSYWTDHSLEASVEAMMLDSQAKMIDREERPEVLAMLGCVEEKRILELGAGIGRFTGPLAVTARSVLAVDFMEHLIEENKRANGHRRNVKWRAADATELELPAASFDVVFSNWLLMYLSDDEVSKLASDALRWVEEDGIVFFRESCFRQSGDKARKSNPTHYRNPRQYFKIFDDIEMREKDGRYAHYELLSCKPVDAYCRIKKNQNQICWKWRKVMTAEPQKGTFRAFLDSVQYSRTGILRYERIFGPGFVSTGGLETTKEFVELLALKPDERVLDVGCGIGGGDFYMASKYGAFVHGVDLSVNMVTTALERAFAAKDGHKVTFEIADITSCELTPESYDVVYSRDTILHIHDKPALFKRFLKVLKPGGRLLISDYCKAPGQPSEDFAVYIKQRGYDLHSVEEYGRMLQGAGFAGVKAEDRTWQFKASLKRELKTAQEGRAAFVSDFSEKHYDAIIGGWQDKLERVAGGAQKWGLFTATKPAA